MKRANIRIAVQKEGRLKEPSLAYLKSLGIGLPNAGGRTLLNKCRNANAEIMLVRHVDAPQYVQCGAADFAIVGGNILHENSRKVSLIKELPFGQCSLVIAVPRGSRVSRAADLEGERIATSYPNSLRKFLKERSINAVIIEIKGSVELAPKLGLADAVCDLMQSGTTLRENSLKPIAKLFNSTAALIESPFESAKKADFKKKFLLPPQ